MLDKNTDNQPQTVLNCQGKLLNLSQPKVMGILNINEDSFYAKSRISSANHALFQVDKMLDQGADIIDIGGMSSRPGAELISPEEECSRILPILKAIRSEFQDLIISIDTIYSSTAKQVIDAGANIINDISAGKIDSEMISTVGQLNCPYIIMHMVGKPTNMQSFTDYNDLLLDITDYFIDISTKCQLAGIKDLMIDPGFGFSKTIEQNFMLLNRMNELNIFGFPIVAGVSRKSMIWKTIQSNSQEALNGTTALHMSCLERGAKILRVHDVKEAVECVKLYSALHQ